MLGRTCARVPRRSDRCVALALAVLLTACGSSTEPRVPTNISLSTQGVTLDAVGATVTLSADVLDQSGEELDEATVTWSSSDETVATVSSSGTVTAVSNGTAQITASSDAASESATVTVDQVITRIEKVGGDAQTGTVGEPLAEPLEVRAFDRLDQPAEGRPISFDVTSGNGTVDPASPQTDEDGFASTTWTLGTTAGTEHAVQADAPQASAVAFTATAEPGPSSAIEKVSGDGQTWVINVSLPDSIVVRVTDEFGNGIAGETVSFEPDAGSGTASPATIDTDADGRAATEWTLGSDEGQDTLRVVVGSPTPSIFAATAVEPGDPVNATVNDGDGQTGLVGFAVNIPPSILVTDADGFPVPNVDVTFDVTGGGGSATDASVLTDLDGIAEVGSWTLGSTPATNTLDATPGSLPAVPFEAEGVEAAYDIEVRFLTSMTPTQEQAFLDAAARWGEIIYGDLSDIHMTLDPDECGPDSPAIDETVDDLLIFATVDSIDGPGNIAGQASPCFVRTSNTLPIVGFMIFDEDDIDDIEDAGLLEVLILHEMGHVIGVGGLWHHENFDLVVDAGGDDPHFIGQRGLKAFDRIGGESYSDGEKVPVENEGGQGTRDVHWRESVFDNELMTGILDLGDNPFSEQTAASVWDMGYLVNLAGSDAYSVTLALRIAGGGPGLPLVNDVADWPIRIVDDAGRQIGTLQPAGRR